MKKIFYALIVASTSLQAISQEIVPIKGYAYLSIYGGWGLTSSGTIQGSVLDSVNPMVLVDFDKAYDESSAETAGLRLGVWIDDGRFRNWGFAFDTWYYKVSPSPVVQFGVVPVGLMVMYHFPLLDGKVEPYAGAGGFVSFVDVDVEVELPDGSIRNLDGNLSDGGWEACAGCSLSITERISMFIEYRYVFIHISMDNPDTDSGNFGAFNTDLSTQQILAGLSLKLKPGSD